MKRYQLLGMLLSLILLACLSVVDGQYCPYCGKWIGYGARGNETSGSGLVYSNATDHQTGYGPGYGMGPWMMYGYAPGYNINATGTPTYYGYWMGPWMMYGYAPGYNINATGTPTYYGYWMGPWMMYGYAPGYNINATGSQLGYGSSYRASIADELKKLADLKKLGTITENEFNQLKNRLINQT
jgi:hypothetical protein